MKQEERVHRRVFAQNFLQDKAVSKRIVDAAGITKQDTVLEIGPGDGALTVQLSEQAGKLLAIEKDRELMPNLLRQLSLRSNTMILEADALSYNFSELLPKPSDGICDYIVVSNLPYNAATPILRMLVSGVARPKRIIAMIQKEVAERMTATPPDMSFLGLAMQWYADMRVLFVVPPEAFSPKPKVDSAVIEIIPKPFSMLPEPDEKGTLRVAKLGFSQKRKKLSNNLGHALSLDKKVVEKLLVDLGLTKEIRAEALTLKNWLELAKKLET